MAGSQVDSSGNGPLSLPIAKDSALPESSIGSDSGAAPAHIELDPNAAGKPIGRWRLLFLLLLLLGTAGVGCYVGLPYVRAEYHRWAAERARQRREFALARSHLSANLAAYSGSAGDHFLMARVARQSGTFDSAEEELNQCERLEGATARIALERALLQAQEGALTPLNERQLQIYIAQGHSDALYILEALGLGSLASYRFGRAHGYLSEWIDREPVNFQPYLLRSLADERLEDSSAALDDARQAAALGPDRFDTSFRLAEMLYLNGRNEEAAALYAQLYQGHPRNPDIALGLAQSLQKLSRLQEAAQILDALRAVYPDNSSALFERGRLALQMNEVARAEELLLRGASIAPSDYLIQYTLLQCLKQQGKDTRPVEARIHTMEEAQAPLKELNEKLKKHPNDLLIRCEIARIYLGAENAKEALNWLKSVLKFDPSHQLANEMLADYYEKSGQPALAVPYRAAAGMGTR
jgi:tetratricopeptide (TPR) repeat protein